MFGGWERTRSGGIASPFMRDVGGVPACGADLSVSAIDAEHSLHLIRAMDFLSFGHESRTFSLQPPGARRFLVVEQRRTCESHYRLH